MPGQKGNERPEGYYYEERETRNAGGMPGVRDQDVQNREELIITSYTTYRGGWLFIYMGCQPPFRCTSQAKVQYKVYSAMLDEFN